MRRGRPAKRKGGMTFEELLNCAVSEPARFGEIVATDRSVLETRSNLGETLLHWLAIEGFTEAVQRLLGLGADANTADKFGNPVLPHAVIVKQTAIVRALLEAGADPNGASHGDPALLLAVAKKCPELVELLLTHGASTDLDEDASPRLCEAVDKCKEPARSEIESALRRHGWTGA